MARERREVEVNGIMYSISQISPTQGSLIFLKLLRIFSPALPKAFTGGKLPTQGQLSGMKFNLKDIQLDKVIEVIADRMEEGAIMAMARKLLSQSHAVGVPSGGPTKLLGTEAMFDAHFEETSGILHIAMVVKEVLQLQYADFFEGLGILDNVEAVPDPGDTASEKVP